MGRQLQLCILTFKNLYINIYHNDIPEGESIGKQSFSKEILKSHILYKLARHNRWGGKHTELINVRSALPQKARGQAEQLAKELADEGMLTWLKKTGQIHISLNPHKKKEIVERVQKYLGIVLR